MFVCLIFIINQVDWLVGWYRMSIYKYHYPDTSQKRMADDEVQI